jgi:glycerophosphoryl diester phosphodiesterase
MSFSGVALSRVQRHAPDLEVVLLIESAVSWKVVQGMLRPGWIAGPGIDTLKEKPRLQRRLVEEQLRVHVWVVNTEADLQLCLDLGAEAVMTDRPDLLRAWMDDR